jgi:pilus assembly protein CpaC
MKMFLFALLVAFAIPATAVPSSPRASETLAVGAGRLIKLERAAASLFVADPGIADVQVRGQRLVYLAGKKPGSTTLYAVDAAGEIIANIDVSVGFDTTALTATLERLLPGRVITASTANDALVLSGTLASAADADAALQIAARFIADHDTKSIINRMAVDEPEQINVRVRVVEVSRDVVKQLGFNWSAVGGIGSAALGFASGNPFAGGGAVPPALPNRSGSTEALFGAFQQGKVDLNLLIDALDDRGLVTLLAEPNLTALSGSPASFLAGGEYPIPVPQGQNVTTIESKRFGVSLAVVATAIGSGRINLNVRPEVSQLSSSGAVQLNGIIVPALTTRRAETTVELASGQSFAIAGLLQESGRNNLRKFPGLGDVPVLGSLFRSRKFLNNQTELVIIVTPYLVRPSANALPIPNTHPQQTEKR